MTAHAWWDLGQISSSLVLLCAVFYLLGQRRYWKRIARLHENMRITAMELADSERRVSAALTKQLREHETDA